MKAEPAPALQDTLDRLFRRTAHGIRPGLDVITRLADQLGHPEQSYPCIHVAGTNGKGSVCALISSVLRAAGYRVGLYTSPHLVDFNERFQINGAPMPDAELVKWISLIEPVADAIAQETGGRPATFFECATAIAFAYFKAQQVDWAVVETGMGGRWDATNIARTACSVITPIGYDHTDFLGKTLTKIAGEKAGIIKKATPVVYGVLDDEADAVVVAEATGAGAPLFRAAEQVRVERIAQDWTGQRIRVETQERTCRPMRLPLIGRHQLENTALAIAACEVLASCGTIELDDRAIHDGVESVIWPARGHVLSDDPVTVLDVAHNPHGAAALIRMLDECLKSGQPLGMVVGFLKDKDVAGSIQAFNRRAARYWAVTVPGDRAMPEKQLADLICDSGKPVSAYPLHDALNAARAWARKEQGVVCIAGSLYLAGDVLKGYKSEPI